MKIFDLITCLEPDEKADISAELGQYSRGTLLKTFDLAIAAANIAEVDKAIWYQSIFGLPYEEQKDYLLRNELRLLSQIIEEFIVRQEVVGNGNVLKNTGWKHLLRRFERKGAFSLYEKEWKKKYRKAVKKKDWSLLANLWLIWISYLKKNKELSVELFKELDYAGSQAMHFEALNALENIRKSELEKAVANRHLKAFVPTHEMPSIWTGMNYPPAEQEEILRYLRLRITSYQVSGVNKLKIIEELIDLYPLVSAYREEYREDINLLWGTIGLEYFLAGEYKKADEAYRKAFAEADRLKLSLNINLYYNFVSNLMKLEQYEALVVAIRKKWSLITKHQNRFYRFEYLLAMSYIFLNEPKPAFQLIHRSINQRPESEYYNFRFLYAICFYLMNDPDQFEREINNINQQIQYRVPVETEYPLLARLFQQFIRVEYYMTDTKEILTFRQSILEEISTLSADWPLFQDFFITKWLVGQLERQG